MGLESFISCLYFLQVISIWKIKFRETRNERKKEKKKILKKEKRKEERKKDRKGLGSC